MTEQKRKRLYWLFKILSIIISCAFPLWAIFERFPIWREEHGTNRTIGVGAILIIFIVAIIFRKAVFAFIKDKLKLKYAPPLTVWLILIVVSNILVYIGEVMRDMTTVFWMGLIGCVIGTVLTYISERFNTKEVTSDE